MSKNDQNEIEDIEPEAPEENLTATDVESSDEEFAEENIPEDKPERKKVAALRARHKLEDYFELKKIKEALEYLEEEAAAKKAASKAAKDKAKEKHKDKVKQK